MVPQDLIVLYSALRPYLYSCLSILLAFGIPLMNFTLSFDAAESEDEDTVDGSIIFQLLQSVAIPVIGNVCHVFMHGLNHIQVTEDIMNSYHHRFHSESD